MKNQKTVLVFQNGERRAVMIPPEFDFVGVNEMTMTQEGNTLVLRPVRPSWTSLSDHPKADSDFLTER